MGEILSREHVYGKAIIQGIVPIRFDQLQIESQIYSRIDVLHERLRNLTQSEEVLFFTDFMIEFTEPELEFIANNEVFRKEIIEYILQMNRIFPQLDIRIGVLEGGNFPSGAVMTNFGLSVSKIMNRE